MSAAPSVVQSLAMQGDGAISAFLDSLSPDEAALLPFEWSFWARPEQLEPPGAWFLWLCQCGRGWGKTRTAVEFVRARIDSGVWRVVNVAGPTWTDVMDTMVNGSEESPGLLRAWPKGQAPVLRRSQDDPHLLCHNGAKIRLRAAHSAERFRGPQADGGWADEVDSWKPDGITPAEAWSIFELGIRTGSDPRICVTSTPKRHGLVAKLATRPDCHVTRGSTYDNRANLAPRFFDAVVGPLKGTRLGEQEIEGKVLPDVAGAIVTAEMIDRARVASAPELVRTAVAIDPAVTAGEDSDETGITAGGVDANGHGYVTHDRSCRMSPLGWARRAIDLYEETEASVIVAEKNNGGDMVEATLRQISRHVPIRLVSASKAKQIRFQPVGLLYERGMVHHVGSFPALEDQLTAFTTDGYEGDGSPDRGDSAVWLLTELMVKAEATWGDLYS